MPYADPDRGPDPRVRPRTGTVVRCGTAQQRTTGPHSVPYCTHPHLIFALAHQNKTAGCPDPSPVPEFIDPVLGVKMIVFAKISPKRSFSIQSVPIDAGLGLFWTRSDWGVVFKYWSCVEEEISWFSLVVVSIYNKRFNEAGNMSLLLGF